MPRNRSKLSIFFENCRAGKTYRDFANELNSGPDGQLFSYSYIKLIEQDYRNPDKEKFFRFAKLFNLSLAEAENMWNEQRHIVKVNLAFQRQLKKLRGVKSGNDTESP